MLWVALYALYVVVQTTLFCYLVKTKGENIYLSTLLFLLLTSLCLPVISTFAFVVVYFDLDTYNWNSFDFKIW
jgi:hypothetical protein